MRGPLLALCFLSLSLAWLVFFGAGVRQADWNAALLFVGATALFYWTFRSGQTPPRLPTWHLAVLWSLPIYALFQLLPLPPWLLGFLSPARAVIANSLGGVLSNPGNAPIALAPPAAMSGLFSLLGYLTVFSLMRDLKWRFVEHGPWIPAIPLAFIVGIESSIGTGQWLGGAAGAPLRGTLANAEHFAGLLEIALPFTLVFGYISFRRHQTQLTASSIPAARATGSWLASLFIILALFHSSSQTSHAVVFGSLYVLACFAVIPRLKTKQLRLYGLASAAGLALVMLLVVVPPTSIVESLAQIGATEKTPADSRLWLWSNSAALLAEYRWFGTGIGGFEPAFLKYQGSTDLSRIQNPHNDALSLLISMGMIGTVIFIAALVGVVRPAIMGAIFLVDEPRRLLAVSVTASMTAVMLRSGLESNLSVPVIALAFAWLAGLSQSSGLD